MSGIGNARVLLMAFSVAVVIAIGVVGFAGHVASRVVDAPAPDPAVAVVETEGATSDAASGVKLAALARLATGPAAVERLESAAPELVADDLLVARPKASPGAGVEICLSDADLTRCVLANDGVIVNGPVAAADLIAARARLTKSGDQPEHGS